MSKIIILTPGFPENEQDTSCVPLVWQTVLTLARKAGPDSLNVVTLQYPFKASKYQFKNIPITAVGGRNRTGLRRLFTVIKTIWLVSKIVRGNKNNTYLSFWYTETAIAGKLSAALFGGKHFIWLQGQDARPGNPYVRRARTKAGNIIALSKSQADEFQNNYKIRPAHIIGSGIDPNRFPGLNTNARPIDLISVGSLVPVKNHAAFVSVVKSLKTFFPHIRAEIAGDGPERDRLIGLITSAGLTENIKLCGALPHQLVLEKMAQSRILIHTSNFEGYGTVIPEALYSGCSVIAGFSPESRPVKNLFVCDTAQAMEKKAIDLLTGNTIPERVLIRSIGEIADQIIGLVTATKIRG